jgi:hypothetical protein
MKNAVFWDVAPFRFVCYLTAYAVPHSRILFTLKMEVTHSSEMSVPTRPTWRHIPQNGILLIFLTYIMRSTCTTNNMVCEQSVPNSYGWLLKRNFITILHYICSHL